MKIISLQAENLKRLVAVEIKPDGNLVEITGRNGQGKTSVLDAIWWALEGTTHIQAEPIRKGANSALIKLDLGELRVTRTFAAQDAGGYTTKVIVENADGARFPSPQSMLDALVGELSFDPLAFTRMKPKEQFDMLKGFVPGVDFDQIARARQGDYDARTTVNRQAQALRAQADGITIPEGVPTERVDEGALVKELEDAGRHNAELEQRKARRQSAEQEIESALNVATSHRSRAAEHRTEADRLEAEAKGLEDAAAATRTKLAEAPALPEPIDPAAVRSKIEAARLANEVAGRIERRDELLAQAEDFEGQSEKLTASIKRRDDEKQKAIAAAKMPVEGLAFGDDAVLLNGVPFDQASDAEQLRASIAIAAAMNPKLRVIRVRDGSLLDTESMTLLGQMAEQMEMQVWVETVASGRPGAVMLEDGMVKAAPQLVAAE